MTFEKMLYRLTSFQNRAQLQWAIAFNLRTPTWLKTYLFFLPLKTSVKYGLNPEEFRENQSFTPK